MSHHGEDGAYSVLYAPGPCSLPRDMEPKDAWMGWLLLWEGVARVVAGWSEVRTRRGVSDMVAALSILEVQVNV